MGTREDLRDLIQTCRGFGVRVYIDAVLNHFTGAGNDMLKHRNPNGCVTWGNKTSSAPSERQSPFYTHAFTFEDNVNTDLDPSNEFPGAAIGTDDFHCDRALNTWTDLFILNNGWLVGLTDIDTSKDNVRERQAAYLVDMLSLGASGFRFDAAKHISPQDLSGMLKKVQTKMGGQLPDDFFVWLEVLTGKTIYFVFIFAILFVFAKAEKLILSGKDHHGMELCLKVFSNKILVQMLKLIK
jgi:alpha-amylase